MNKISPAKQLEGFLAKFDPKISRSAKTAIVKMRKLLPHAVEMVYDNYNALVVGFGPTERPSEAIFSIVIFPRYFSLCFIQGARMPDPHGLLQGNGNQVRHIRLVGGVASLDEPKVRGLMDQAVKSSDVPFDAHTKHRIIIKSISAKQRPRRPK